MNHPHISHARPILPHLTLLALLALLSAGITGCTDIEAPELKDHDTFEFKDILEQQDTTPNEDTTKTPDITEDKDTSIQNRCLSDNDCDQDKQFCALDGEVCTNYPQLALGIGHSCAILPNGDVKCWGINNYGQLGRGTIDLHPQPTPTQVALNAPARLISAGADNTCVVLTSDEIYCWGHKNADGGIATLPAQIIHGMPNSKNSITQIVSGHFHSCVLDKPGNVYCWGSNTNGQLGINKTPTAPDLTTAQHVNTAPGNKQISAAHKQTCVVTVNDTVNCWGANKEGELGILNKENEPTKQDLFVPTQIPRMTNVTTIAVGSDHVCAINDANALKCWGVNDFGQLGNDNDESQPPPILPSLIGKTQHVATGRKYTLALSTNGNIHVAGLNREGQLAMGEGTKNEYTKFVPNPQISFVHRLEAGNTHACAIHKNGKISCWGNNSTAALGTGEASSIVTSPTNIILD